MCWSSKCHFQGLYFLKTYKEAETEKVIGVKLVSTWNSSNPEVMFGVETVAAGTFSDENGVF